jgi:hypothetical protein
MSFGREVVQHNTDSSSNRTSVFAAVAAGEDAGGYEFFMP